MPPKIAKAPIGKKEKIHEPSSSQRQNQKGMNNQAHVSAQMKSETKSGKDDLVKQIGALAKDTQKLARVAVQQYSVEVDAILKAQSSDSRQIERCLDGMLDFCFDDEMLVLYKKLCRYYYEIDTEAAVSYVHIYREMWDDLNPAKPLYMERAPRARSRRRGSPRRAAGDHPHRPRDAGRGSRPRWPARFSWEGQARPFHLLGLRTCPFA